MEVPQYPAGVFVSEDDYGAERRAELIADIERLPAHLRRVTANLSSDALEVRYRNWTVRQIVHHLADSHLNSFIRFKLALTEDQPTIKPYHEELWVALEDSRCGNIFPSLALLESLHARWLVLLNSLADQQFARKFFHPATSEWISLNTALSYYAWHGKHHVAQIAWLQERHGW